MTPSDQSPRVASPEPCAGDAAALVAAYFWNLATDSLTWDQSLASVIDFADEDAFATGLGYAGFIAPESTSSRYEAITASSGCDIGGGVAFQVTYGLTSGARGGGTTVWIEDSGRWFCDANGRPGMVQGTIRCVTERYEAERLLARAAQRDPLTGAYKHDAFLEQIERHLVLSSQRRASFAVLVADIVVMLDGGRVSSRAALDEAATAVVSRVRQQMRTNEALGRCEGTRFAMLLENCNGEQMAAAAARLMAAIGDRVEGSSGTATIAMHIGGVVAPVHGRTAADLMEHAGKALAVALLEAKPCFVPYEPELLRHKAETMLSRRADEIVAALNEGRVILALQPIVDAQTRGTVLYEALLRIRLSDGTLLMPEVLVPAAESAGLVALLDRRVVDLAFGHLKADPGLVLSINASVLSLHDPHWQAHCRAACAMDPDAARRLTIEVTETCAVADLATTRAVLLTLKEGGVKIAIDDFGAGHSSFRMLRSLPLDYLKIDGAFARDLAHSADDQFFIRTLIDLAKNLGIPTVAEWVEDEATARMLTAWGIGLLQGHLFGRAEIAEPLGDAAACA